MKFLLSKQIIRQFLKFALIGVLNTLVDLLLLNLLVFFTNWTDGFEYAAQKGFSALCAVIFSYFLNKNWAFNDKDGDNKLKKFSAFFMISLTGMLINVLVAACVVSFFKSPVNSLLNSHECLNDTIWVNIGALTGTAVSMLFNFAGYKLHVFRK